MARSEIFLKKSHAYVDGRDPEASPPCTLRRVQLWNGVPRRWIVGRVRHGQRVRVLDRIWYVPDGRWYYRVRRWFKSGWLPGRFLSHNKHPPLGDVIK